MPPIAYLMLGALIGGALGLVIGWLYRRGQAVAPDDRLANELRQQLTQRDAELVRLREHVTTATTAPPTRTPARLTPVSAASAAAAVTFGAHGIAMPACAYWANATETAAMPPVCTTRRFDQPYRNPAAGCTPSRR